MLKLRLDFEDIASTAILAARCKRGGSWGNDEDTGYLSKTEAVAMAATGDVSFARKAEKILERMNIPTGTGMTWQPSVAGGYVIVPEALIGRPDCMRRKTRTPKAGVPVKVWIDSCMSAGVSRETYNARGVAIMALIMRLNATRPLEVVSYSLTMYHSEYYLLTTRLETHPLDLSLAGYVIAHPAWQRHLLQSIKVSEWGLNLGVSYPVRDARRDLLECGADDIVIAGSDIRDADMLRNPLEWVNRMANAIGA